MRNYFASPSLYIGLLSLALPLAVAAQSTTSLRGTVTDPSGSAIPDAVLTLTNAGTGFKRQVLTSADGVYQFLQAPPGTYQIAAAKPGFNPLARSGVELLVNSPSTVDLRMEVGTNVDVVNVSAEAAVINTCLLYTSPSPRD